MTAAEENQSARDRRPRCTIAILAIDEADLVLVAAGFLFDRIRGGWAVEVYLNECRDERPLRILGVRPTEIVVGKAFDPGGEWPDAVVATAAAYRGNTLPVEHRLSAAARSFKAHALDAAGLPPTDVSSTEAFSALRRVPARSTTRRRSPS